MAGEVTKDLINIVRDKIKDNNNSYFKTDEPIAARLNFYQDYFMQKHLTNLELIEINLVADQYSYSLPDKVVTVIRIYTDDKADHCPSWMHKPFYDGEQKISNRTVAFQETGGWSTSGVKMYIECYVKAENNISLTVDPVININHEFLADAVAAEHRERLKDVSLLTLNQIDFMIRSLRQGNNPVISNNKVRSINF